MLLAKGLLYCWDKNTQYGPQLVADLSDEQMVLQPAPDGKAPANHPAWVFSHLNVYLPVIRSLLLGQEFDDPKHHSFGMQSKPESDARIYSPKNQLLETFVTGHQQIRDLLANCDNAVFEQPVKLERWVKIMPTVAIALPYLMLNHENQHLGQISAWRRIQGLASV